MKKFLLALVVLSGAAFNSFAQTDKEGGFSVGLEAGLPLGTAKDVYNFAIGGSLKYDVSIGEGLLFNVSAGYTSLGAKTFNGIKGAALGVVPVKAGIKYFFSEGFYGEAQAGAAFFTKNGGGTAFAYSPGVGYAFDGGFDIGFRYEAWSKTGTISQLATRIAYSF